MRRSCFNFDVGDERFNSFERHVTLHLMALKAISVLMTKCSDLVYREELTGMAKRKGAKTSMTSIALLKLS